MLYIWDINVQKISSKELFISKKKILILVYTKYNHLKKIFINYQQMNYHDPLSKHR